MGWEQDSIAAATETRLPVPAWQRDEVAGTRRDPMVDVPGVAAGIRQHFHPQARAAKT